ncbi:putative methyltransferase-domain-containing protein [Hygrophoropsis aurantiaca]|uniref:Methyltransferase-domain-containing protein n=1 Tax=Hygrophoropsis aurantiaca TaxID=72124 RepID=A0ACB7ZZ96_9AGAM|nr:putative methyltransferase-domain-containing protein [Hygrophoropsis aurantiaca]
MSEDNKNLFSLLWGYSALVAPQKLVFPTHLPFSIVQHFLIHHILLNPHLEIYSPSERYQYTFWKWVTQCLETMPQHDDDEIDDRIYERYISLLGQSRSGPPPQSYTTYYWKSLDVPHDKYQSITLLESRKTIESGTTGLRTWRASFVLADYLIAHPGVIAQKNILELGCGTGFVGIIAAGLTCSDPRPIYMTDVNEDVLARCQNNTQLPCNPSSLHPNVRYCTLNWSDAIGPAVSPLRSMLSDVAPEMILGADLVFDHALFPSLVGVLALALENGANALIALTIRNEDTLKEFLRQAQEGLQFEELLYTPSRTAFVGPSDGDVDGGQEVKIFRFSKKGFRLNQYIL